MPTDLAFRRTRNALLWTSFLNEPLYPLCSLLAFILHKDLFASTFQIAVLLGLRPVVSIFSAYWSAFTRQRRSKLIPNLVWAGVIGHSAFFLFPFVDNIWALIGIATLYQLMVMGGKPAWLEILKINLPKKEREQLYSWSSVIYCIEGVVIGLIAGIVLDMQAEAWRWLFPLSGAIGLIGVWLQSRIPIPAAAEASELMQKTSWQEVIARPWTNAWKLLTTRPDFRHFQWGFMFAGFGVMVIQPALPSFFVDYLGLSYTDLSIALSVCKGLAFAASSRLWAEWMQRMDIFRFAQWVAVTMGLFPLLLILGVFGTEWIYIAYFIYGISQAGSHLCWNLSGAVFAKDQDSSVYSSVNVVTIGLRGCFAPALGSVLCAISPILVLFFGGALLMCGSYHQSRMAKRPLATAQKNHVSKSSA